MVVRIIMSILINLILLVWFVIYTIRYNLGQSFIAHVLKNKGSIDRIHRLQMRRKAGRKKLTGFLDTLSSVLRNMGFRSMLPGSSPLWEAGISLYISIDLIILSGFLGYSLFVRMMIGIFVFILIPVSMQSICRKRTYEAEGYLADLGKMVENAAIQYHSIADIFANHYNEFTGALSYACEEYYINTLVNKDEKRSMEDFKNKFCSPMIDIMIENLYAGQDEDHDLAMIGQLSAKAAEDYAVSTGGNRNMLKEARRRVTVSLIFILVLFFALGLIAGGLSVDGLFGLMNYKAYEVSFIPEKLQSGLGIYLLIISGILYLLGVYQKKGF